MPPASAGNRFDLQAPACAALVVTIVSPAPSAPPAPLAGRSAARVLFVHSSVVRGSFGAPQLKQPTWEGRGRLMADPG